MKTSKGNPVTQTRLSYLLIICVGFIANFILLANPSYFSQDEWQIFYLSQQNGAQHFFKQILDVKALDSFGTPYRPFSFSVMFLENYFFENYPAVVHLMSLVPHIANALLIFKLVDTFTKRQNFALVSSVIFVVSPLTSLSVGWSAALMDVWFVFFSLLGVLVAKHYLSGDRPRASLFLISALSAASFLSKETGIFSAAFLLIFYIYRKDFGDKFRQRFFAVIFAWLVPALGYLIFRIPSISNSLLGIDKGPYETNIENILPNLLGYFAYPFTPLVTEASGVFLQSGVTLTAAAMLHLVLIALGAKLNGVKTIILYTFGYFWFLAPMLTLGFLGAHYMYASAIPLALLCGSLIFRIPGKFQYARAISAFSLAVLFCHSFVFQIQIYRDGTCMQRLNTSLLTIVDDGIHDRAINVVAEPGAPGHVLSRFLYNRNQIGDIRPVDISNLIEGRPSSEGLIMDGKCMVYRE